MVGHSKSLAAPGNQYFATHLFPYGNVSMLPEGTVERYRFDGRSNAIIRQKNNLNIMLFIKPDQIFAKIINFLQIRGNPRVIRSDSLQIVIQVRDVNQA